MSFATRSTSYVLLRKTSAEAEQDEEHLACQVTCLPSVQFRYRGKKERPSTARQQPKDCPLITSIA